MMGGFVYEIFHQKIIMRLGEGQYNVDYVTGHFVNNRQRLVLYSREKKNLICFSE